MWDRERNRREEREMGGESDRERGERMRIERRQREWRECKGRVNRAELKGTVSKWDTNSLTTGC